KFTPQPGSKAPIEMGKAEILVDDAHPDDKVGFVIDGQHRVAAFERRPLEKNEVDMVVGVVVFRAPEDETERELFDEFVLKQMETINTAVALSDTEKDLVTQRLGQVFEALGKELRATATLVVKLLDGKPKSPVKFQAQNKKPTTKDEKWLSLSV